MANPFASQVKGTSSAKFKAITGKKSSGQSHPDGAQDSKAKAFKSSKPDEYNVGGTVSVPSFARGGRSKGKKSGKTNINIIIAGKGGPEEGGLPPKPPMAPMAPPPGVGPPGAGAPPPGMPPGMPPMKRGGAAYAKGGKVPMTAGGESGKGRLQKIKAYGLSPKKAG